MDPWLLFSGFVISMIGLGLFMYGRKMDRFRNVGIGLVMMVFPVVVHSVLWMWVIAGACLAAVIFVPDGG